MAAIGGVIVALAGLMTLYLLAFAYGMMGPAPPDDPWWGQVVRFLGSRGAWGPILIGTPFVILGAWLIRWARKDHQKLIDSMWQGSARPHRGSQCPPES